MREVKESMGVYATAFCISRDVLRRILAEAGVAPVGQRSGHPIYAMKAVFAAVMTQQRPATMNPHARLALARAEKVEDEIKVRRGELVDAFDVERGYGELLKNVVRGFDTAVDTLERDVGLSPLQADRLERHFDQCRENVYREILDDRKGAESTDKKGARENRRDSNGASRGSRSTSRLRKTKSSRRRKKSAT